MLAFHVVDRDGASTSDGRKVAVSNVDGESSLRDFTSEEIEEVLEIFLGTLAVPASRPAPKANYGPAS